MYLVILIISRIKLVRLLVRVRKDKKCLILISLTKCGNKKAMWKNSLIKFSQKLLNNNNHSNHNNNINNNNNNNNNHNHNHKNHNNNNNNNNNNNQNNHNNNHNNHNNKKVNKESILTIS